MIIVSDLKQNAQTATDIINKVNNVDIKKEATEIMNGIKDTKRKVEQGDNALTKQQMRQQIIEEYKRESMMAENANKIKENANGVQNNAMKKSTKSNDIGG